MANLCLVLRGAFFDFDRETVVLKWFLKVGAGSYKYLYNGKELQDELGLEWYDYGARMYDAQLGRFFTQDRFAEKYLSYTPYHYTMNNPIIAIDINGDSTVYISGKDANKATQALNSTTSNLNITRNSNTEALSYTGKPVSDYEKELASAIDDDKVIIDVKTGQKTAIVNLTESGVILGGAFGGSEVKADGSVVATQYVDMGTAEQYAEVSGNSSGDVVGHEVLEAYIAAKDNPGASMKDHNAYISAHTKSNSLLPQKVVRTGYDAQNGFHFKPGRISPFENQNKPQPSIKIKRI